MSPSESHRATGHYTPPPFDAELAEYLPELQEFLAPDGLQPHTIQQVRAKLAEWPVPSLDDLRRGGQFEVMELTVDAATGAVPLLLCRPVHASLSRLRRAC